MRAVVSVAMALAVKHVTSLKMTMKHGGASLDIIDNKCVALSHSDDKMATRMMNEPFYVVGGFVAFMFNGDKTKQVVNFKGDGALTSKGPLCILDEPKVLIGPKGPDASTSDDKDIKDDIAPVYFPGALMIMCMAEELFQKCCILDPNMLKLVPALEQVIIAQLEEHLKKVYGKLRDQYDEDDELRSLTEKLKNDTLTKEDEKELYGSIGFYHKNLGMDDALAILSGVSSTSVKDVNAYYQLMSDLGKNYNAILRQYTLHALKSWGNNQKPC